MGAQRTKRLTRGGRNRARGREKHKLLPGIPADVRTRRGIDAAHGKRTDNIPDTSRLGTAELTHQNPLQGPGVCNDTRPRAVDQNISDRSQHALGTDRAGDHVVLLNAVLQREDGGLVADHGYDSPGCDFGVPQFDRDNYKVDRSDVRRLGYDVYGVELHVAELAPDLEARTAHGRGVIAARDEEDIVSGQGQTGAVVATHGPGSHDGDLHVFRPPVASKIAQKFVRSDG